MLSAYHIVCQSLPYQTVKYGLRGSNTGGKSFEDFLKAESEISKMLRRKERELLEGARMHSHTFSLTYSNHLLMINPFKLSADDCRISTQGQGSLKSSCTHFGWGFSCEAAAGHERDSSLSNIPSSNFTHPWANTSFHILPVHEIVEEPTLSRFHRVEFYSNTTLQPVDNLLSSWPLNCLRLQEKDTACFYFDFVESKRCAACTPTQVVIYTSMGTDTGTL